MRITTVEATNLKGRTFKYNLEPMNLIVGENFTGKTSIIDAIRLALIGYIPELGKLPRATWELSSGSEMEAKVSFNQVFTHPAGDEPFSAEVSVSAQMSGGTVKLTRNTPHDFGSIPLLNASAYFAKSERDRYDYVFRLAEMPEMFDEASLISALDTFDSPDLVIAVAACFKGKTVQEGIIAAIEELSRQFTKWNTRAKDTQGAIRTMTELKNRQEAMVGNVRQFQTEFNQAQVEASEAYTLVTKLEVQREAHAQREKRKTRLVELENALAMNVDQAKLEKLIEEATGTLAKVIDPNFNEEQLAAWEFEFNELTRQIENMTGARQEAETKRNEAAHATECPYCGTKAKGWQDKLLKTFNVMVTQYTNKLADLQLKAQTEQAALAKCWESWNEAQAALAHNKRVNESILGWQRQIDTLKSQRAKWEKQLTLEREELAAPIEFVSDAALHSAREKAGKAKKKVDEAQAKLRQADRLEQDIQRAAQAELEHNKAEAYTRAIKEMRSQLFTRREAMVEYVFTNLLKIANEILAGVLTSPLAFFDGDIGRWHNDMFVTHRTFSGTEQALTFVAIAAALSQKAPIRLLIFDELGRLDIKRRDLLFNLLRNSLNRGYIDQFILAGTPEVTGFEAIDGSVNVIPL